MANQSDSLAQEKRHFVPDIKSLQEVTGVEVVPPTIPDWGTVYHQELLETCKTLAAILLLQQTATEKRNEELQLQDRAHQNYSKLERDLLPVRTTKIQKKDLCAKTDELAALLTKMEIKNQYEIRCRLQKVGLLNDVYQYDESSTPTHIGYRIPEAQLPRAYELIQKWVADGTK